MADKNKKQADGVLKKIKNIFAHLKHLQKDPVNNMEEVTVRLKEIKKLFLISIIILAVPLLAVFLLLKVPGIGAIISGILLVPVAVGAILFMYAFFLLSIMQKVKAKFIALECPNCKTIIKYGDSVSYEVKREYETRKTSTSNDRTDITQEFFVELLIKCKCQECGTEKEIYQTFRTATYKNGRCLEELTLDKLVIGFFGNKVQF